MVLCADVVVLVAALVVACSVAVHAGARQQRCLTVGVVVAVKLQRHVAAGQRHQSVGLVTGHSLVSGE